MIDATPVVLLTQIKKRDGRIVPFEIEKIVSAIQKAMRASGEGTIKEAREVAAEVVASISVVDGMVPSVERIQDEIEKHLILNGYTKTSKSYILYRAERSKIREERGGIPRSFKKLAEESKKYFAGNPLGEFVYLRTYARWIESEQRRETWIETVDRYVDFMKENLGKKLTEEEYTEIREAILKQEVMPSMRAMQFSGEPARRCNTCFYNCSYVAPIQLEDFAEIMYLSMQGCGVGFSVESEAIQQLPQIKKFKGTMLDAHVVADSREGWCDALTAGLKAWYSGKDIEFDYSKVRPAGTRLQTQGGKASGPEPLQSLLVFARDRIIKRQGRRLRNIDAHDIICKIGECVVAGGVRRTAMISLSDLDDADMRDAKKGQFFLTDQHRSVANNSAVYEVKPTNTELMDEWLALMKSGSGERGIFNRGNLGTVMPARRVKYFEDKYGKGDFGLTGTNPCGEITLQSKEFCNLSEVIARSDDTEESLLRKTRLATILGTYQSSLIKFKYISKEWTENVRDERLLGVSITGQWDCPAVRNAETLKKMRDEAVEVNKEYAKRLGVNQSTSITCVKPSGTVSQTFNCSSGLHPRNSKFYIRRIRISATDSLFKLAKDQGIPYFPEVGQNAGNANTYVLEFAVKSPDGSTFKNDVSAIDQLEYWKMVKLNWTEHNPSATVSIGEDEWIGVIDWIQKNWDIVGGLSFLPREKHVYRLAPYEEITEEEYVARSSTFPVVDYAKLITYERVDETEMKKELACAGNSCDIF
jgi:ribonucleoside-diphosphate reductase alpha chain